MVFVAPGRHRDRPAHADRAGPGRGDDRREQAGLGGGRVVGHVGLDGQCRGREVGGVVLHHVRVAQSERTGDVKLDRELDAGVVVGRDLRPVDVVEREHLARVVRVDLQRECVGAVAEERRHVERVPRVVALDGAPGGYPVAVDPHISLADDAVDDQVGVLGAAEVGSEVGPEPPGNRERRDRLGSDLLHVAKARLHVGREEDVRAVAGLDERAYLGADGAGIIRPDVKPGTGGEGRGRDPGRAL